MGQWLRRYHDAVAGFVPPAGARWRMARGPGQPGDVVGHNDAAPYNAVWDERGLVGFIDWDFARPRSPLHDLAFVIFSRLPLHARNVVEAEGFTAFADRPRRLGILLDAYGYRGSGDAKLDAVRERVAELGVTDDLGRALVQLVDDAPTFR